MVDIAVGVAVGLPHCHEAFAVGLATRCAVGLAIGLAMGPAVGSPVVLAIALATVLTVVLAVALALFASAGLPVACRGRCHLPWDLPSAMSPAVACRGYCHRACRGSRAVVSYDSFVAATACRGTP